MVLAHLPITPSYNRRTGLDGAILWLAGSAALPWDLCGNKLFNRYLGKFTS